MEGLSGWMVSDMVSCKEIMENKLYTIAHKVVLVLFLDTFLFFIPVPAHQ